MWKLTDNTEWSALEDQFSWVKNMSSTRQDRIYHAEGNVAIHTQMVIAELLKNPLYLGVDTTVKNILWTAALMHDIEKRSTSVITYDDVRFPSEDACRISSPGHAKKGEYTSREILYKLGCPHEEREMICKIVRHHGLPLWFLEKPNTEKSVVKASMEVNMELLHIISMSDALGRICNDTEDLVFKNDMFEMYCKEMNCWDRAYRFQSDSAKYNYIKKEDGYINYIPFEHSEFARPDDYVTILCGLPGAGKDTYISNSLSTQKVLSLDALRRTHKVDPTDSKKNGQIIQFAKEIARTYLRKRQSFILNATNITKSMRDIWIGLITDYGMKVKIVYIEVPYSKLVHQNSNREYALPQNALDHLVSKLEVPVPWEAHIVEKIIND